MGYPYGFSVYEAGAIGAIPDRPADIVGNEADIFAYFRIDAASNSQARAQLECGYCGQRNRAVLASQLHWFQQHDCLIDEEQASRNRRIMVAKDSERIAA